MVYNLSSDRGLQPGLGLLAVSTLALVDSLHFGRDQHSIPGQQFTLWPWSTL